MKKTLLALSILIASSAAASATDFNQRLYQIDGQPFTEQDGSPEKSPTTLKHICVNALLATYPDESTLAGEQKLSRFDLAKKISDAKGDLKLTANEAQLLKTLILKAMPIVVAGQAVPLIEASVAK
jgi:hypothetical protein